MIWPLFRQARYLGRYRQIAQVLARYGFGSLITLLGLDSLVRLPGRLARRPLDSLTGPQRLRMALVELGPTFVKFGQIMSTRVDLIPLEFIDELKTLQDRVAPIPYSDVQAQIERALGKPAAQLFRTVDEKPLASASIAQVHTATTLDGHDVVIKVQRPNIREKIESDLSLLAFIARQAEEIAPEARLFNLVGMVGEFERSLARETDFTVEAANIDRFQRNFEGHPTVRIPRLHRTLCTDIILCMERIYGRKLPDAARTGNVDDVVKVYLDATYRMIFQDGFFHGDLHPGNALLQDDGKLALLDFGMVGRLNQDRRERLIDLVFAVLSEDMKTVARTFYGLGIPDRRMDYRAYETDVVDVMERHFVGRAMADIQIGVFFRDLASVAMRHRVRLPADYTMLFKALVTTEGLAKQLAPSLNPVEAARPYIEVQLRERYSVDRLKGQLIADALDLSRVARSFPGMMEHVLQDLERGEFTVRVDGGQRLQNTLEALGKSRDRATWGMVSSACILAFALMAGEARGNLNLTVVATTLGLMGTVGMLVLAWSLWRRP